MPAPDPTDILPRLAVRALAPMLLALALTACGTGSPSADGGPAGSIDGTPASGAATGDTGADRSPTPGAATPTDPVAEAPMPGITVPVAPVPAAPASEAATPSVPTPIDSGTEIPTTGVPATDVPTPVGPGTGQAGDEAPETDPGTEDGVDGGTDSGPAGGTTADPIGCDAPPAEMQARALELINAARAEARVCGDRGAFAATGALGWDSRLETAARTHSTDMADTGNFDHTGTDGSSAGDRIERAGYDWGEYAENIAAGQTSLESAVAGWIESPGHCRNLMAPGVSDVAVACVSNEEAGYRRYWTNVLARPLGRRDRP